MARGKRSESPLRDERDIPPPLPSNEEAESSLLGAIFLNNAVYSKVCDTLFQEHFFQPVHGRIYGAIGELIESGAPANPVTLKGRFDLDPALADMGGARYLMSLAESAVTIVNAPFYAEAIVDCYRRRVLIALGQDLAAKAYDASEGSLPVDQQIEDAGTQLFDLTEIGSTDRPRVTSGGDAATQAIEAAQRAYREPGKLAGIGSGIVALDKWTGGFAPGDLYIVGGRPGAGKSALVGSIAWAACASGYPTHIFSGEMPASQLMARLLAAISSVSASRQRRGDLMPADWEALVEAQRTIASWPLTIDDGPMTLPRIRQQLRYGKRRQKTALAIIDYLQLVQSGTESESRLADVGRVSNGLKRAAKDLDMPIIACAQLSRGVEARDDKRPILSDLRESGSIEMDADTILFLYRAEVYLARAEPWQTPNETDVRYQERHAQWSNALADSRGKATIHIAKNRHGDTGTAHVRFDGARTYFHDLQDAQHGLFEGRNQ